MRSLTSLTDRELNQVRAALAFWADMADVSKIHPSHHPSVAPMFKHYAPLRSKEITELLEDTTSKQLVTVREAADVFNLNPDRLRVLLGQYNVPPELVSGQLKLYHTEAVRRAVEKWKRG